MATKHAVAQGECLQTLAYRYGFSDADVIWNHPANTDLRKRRTSMHVLAPGDVVHIPDPQKKSIECTAGQSHKFKIHRPSRNVHVVLVDGDGKPISGSAYVLRVGRVTRKGKTGSDGAVDEKGFRPDIDRGELELIDLGITRTLFIGHLDPHHDESGWRQRLVNLGYDDNEDGLSRFASDRGLPKGTTAEAIRNALHQESKS